MGCELRAALEEASNHLRQNQRSLQDRACGEATGEAAKQTARARRIAEPPEITEEGDAVDVNVLRLDQFQQSRPAMRAPQTALLRRLDESLDPTSVKIANCGYVLTAPPARAMAKNRVHPAFSLRP